MEEGVRGEPSASPEDREKPSDPGSVSSPDWDGIALLIALMGSVLFVLAGTWVFRHGDQINRFFVDHAFWVLAFLPGVIALSNLFFGVLPRRSRRRREITPFVERLADAQRLTSTEAKEEKRTEDIEGLASPAAIVLGAFVLVAVFGIAAALSAPPGSVSRERRPLQIGLEKAMISTPAPTTGTPSASATPTATTSSTPPTAIALLPVGTPTSARVESRKTTAAEAQITALQGTAVATKTPNPTTGASNDESDPINRSGGVSEGVVALVFAVYGAYVYTMILLIVRINSNGVTGKFLFNSAIRSATAMIFGYAIGLFGLFTAMTNAKTSLFLYFALGVFPSWAFDAFRRRARELFQQKETGCESLPICLVDGVDDGTIDRLAEVGVWDIQHLASADAPDLVMRTLFPLQRVLDWIDQAVLISYVKNQISEFRRQGVRSAIELLTIYGDATGRFSKDAQLVAEGEIEDPATREKRGREIMTLLSQKTSFSENSLYAIGRSLFEDGPLNRIWDSWQEVDPTKRHASHQQRVQSTETDRLSHFASLMVDVALKTVTVKYTGTASLIQAAIDGSPLSFSGETADGSVAPDVDHDLTWSVEGAPGSSYRIEITAPAEAVWPYPHTLQGNHDEGVHRFRVDS